MKNFKFSLLSGLLFSLFITGCSNEDDNYKSYEGTQETYFYNSSTTDFEYKAIAPSSTFVVVSTTTSSNVDRVIPIQVNAALTDALPSTYSIDMSTAVIKAGEFSAKVKINSGNFNDLPATGSAKLTLVFQSGDFYVLPNRNGHVVNISRNNCNDTKVKLFIDFDAYASECSWEVLNSSNTQVASSNPYSDGTGSHSEDLCLAPGTYTFVINDSFGDGLDPGSYSLKLTDGTTLVLGSGAYGSGRTNTFVVN